MGKRYFCDYCDRHFADSPGNRKKHINGVQHKRNRKLHYDSFKDPVQLLAEEALKLPCRRFFQTGSCDFGDNCRYSHKNPQMLLEEQAKARSSSSSLRSEPKLSDWLAKWEIRRKYRKGNKNTKEMPMAEEDNTSHIFMLPANLPSLSQLPPSMLPPPPGGYPKLPKVEWG
ncbi:zinc finger matrin-type protein 5-like [Dendronephthya gigantea]|uniref:zinc finger matrin-type protein 5-like n=1 Tax=Dendronephthya gigantea TaxID=151771 RepID=UPI00106A7AB8|nr:zinc finger matrin-type protein 5-like [Dendronephthya gigantea]